MTDAKPRHRPRMRLSSRLFAALLAAGLQACVTQPLEAPKTVAVAPAEARKAVTILISIDGFKPDYLARGVTPNLNALADAGISAAMRPSFPSITFPNHWTIVTGLRPDRNGIVGNKIEDPGHPGMTFNMQSEEPFWWAQAEPIWITAEKAGIHSATMFWPGANVAFDGKRPQDWQQYGHEVSNRQRVDAIIDWLRRPADTRPAFFTLYFDAVDSAGHANGPDSPKTTAVVGEVDAAIGRLRSELTALGQPANFVIVADHGMAAISPDRVVRLDQNLPEGSYRFVVSGPYAGIEPMPGKEAALAAAIAKPVPHAQCWPKAQMPVALHYGRNPRVPAFVCLAETGWLILDKPPAADMADKYRGAHGFDPTDPQMAALFIASGPAIKPAGKIAGFDNVDVAPLLRDLLGLPAGKDLDGSDAPFRGALNR